MKEKSLILIILMIFSASAIAAAPVIISSEITPATAYANTTLVGWCNASDSDSNMLSYNFRWYNGTSLSRENSTEKSALTWWNESFPYRQKINISTSATLFSDNQLKIVINTSNNATSFNWSRLCADIRFTNSTHDGKLNYWIETCNNATKTAVIWVKYPGVITSNASIYMYYGNESASSESDGNSVFLFFDDFSGTSLNTTKWTSWGAGSYTISVSGGLLTISTQAGNSNMARLYSNVLFNTSRLHYLYMITGAGYGAIYSVTNSTGSSYSPSGYYVMSNRRFYSGYSSSFEASNSTNSSSVNVANPANGAWYREEMWFNSTNQSVYRNGTLIGSTAQSMANTSNMYRAWIGEYTPWDTAMQQSVDYMFVTQNNPYPTVTYSVQENHTWELSGNFTPSINYNIANLSGIMKKDENWTFSCQANDSTGVSSWLNSSAIVILSVTRSVSVTTTVSPSSPITNGTNSTFSCSANDTVPLTMYVNGEDKTSENGTSLLRGIGTYVVNCSWEGNSTHAANWTSVAFAVNNGQSSGGTVITIVTSPEASPLLVLIIFSIGTAVALEGYK